ncbi:phage tail protein [Neorhizobium sp. T7_12]|uniref:phage tail protein n=1 Tax=Neorhizobium sp. T7_12 TaxID=2093832 RepID=UPI000CF8E09D|nr:phage tail protein [Neorhizobium sp. T7_12]
MTFSTVLPSTSTTVFEYTLEHATDFADEVSPAIQEIHGIKYARPLNVTVAPWLVHEYGLGPISQFFATIEDTIDEGRPWQRLRGTPAAVTTALGWLDYTSIFIEDQVRGRRRWHLYQIGMGELPGSDEVNRLMSAEYLAGLSDPARSYFWRGYHGYDVRGHVYGRSRWGRSMWGDSSGVRLPGGKVKWSHGRSHLVDATAEAGKAADLAVSYTDGDPLTWLPTITWAAPGVTWEGVTDARVLKSWLMRQKTAYIGVFDADGDAIGYAAVLREVRDITDYEDVSDTVELVYEASIAFGAASGDAASVAVVFGGQSTANKPAKPWLSPAEIDFPDGDIHVGTTAAVFSFQRTIREHVVIHLTI